jgi:hypothetical protein
MCLENLKRKETKEKKKRKQLTYLPGSRRPAYLSAWAARWAAVFPSPRQRRACPRGPPSSRAQQPSPPSRALFFSPYFADRWGQVVSRLLPIVFEPDFEPEANATSVL